VLSTATANHSFSRPLALDSIEARWEVPEELPRLEEGDVHVWRLDLNLLPGDASSQDRATAAEGENTLVYRQAEDRSRHAAARRELRTILAGYTSVDATDMRFERTALGKPMLSSKDNFEKIEFNVSYSGSNALVGVCRNAKVGIDIELVDQQFPFSTVLRRFSDRGLFAINHPMQDVGVRSFFELWTSNEAYAKATGLGLAGLAARHSDFSMERNSGGSDTDDWSVNSFDVGDDLIGAVATSFRPSTILFLNFSGQDNVRNIRDPR
jgi:phosphopantetheinyl transferase